MNIGMLWFDNEPKATLDTKVEKAATYYEKKYGAQPNLCFVHPSALPEVPKGTECKVGPVEVRPSRAVLVNHIWIGYNEVGK